MRNLYSKYSTFIKQSSSTLTTRSILIVLGFIYSVLTARILGPEGKGNLALLLAIPTMLLPLANLGVKQASAYFRGQGIYTAKELYSNMLGIYSISSIFLIGTTLIMYFYLGYERLGILVIVLFTLIAPINMLKDYLNSNVLADKNIKLINYQEILFSVLNISLILMWVILNKLNIFTVGFSTILSGTTTILILLLYYVRMGYYNFKISYKLLLPIVRKGVIFSIALFVLQLNYRIDLIMLENIKGISAVGIYSVGVHIAELLKQLPLALGLVLFSRTINWNRETENIDKLMLLIKYSIRIIAAISLIICIFIVWAVPIVYGEAYYGSIKVIWTLVIGIISLSIFHNLQIYSAGQGKPEIAIYTFIPALLLNIILNYVLIPRLSYIGAGIASTISYSFGALIYLCYFKIKYKIRIRRIII